MRRPFPVCLPVCLLSCLCLCALVPDLARSGEVVSTMRNVNAVMEARGYRLQAAPDYPVPEYPGDHAPAQAFELIRPRGEAVRIGRLFTSCTCVRLEAPKNAFARNERAVFILRNVIPTPVAGQMYAMYIQVTSPLRTTLRIDTFVQSSAYAPMPDAPLIIEEFPPLPPEKEPEDAPAADAPTPEPQPQPEAPGTPEALETPSEPEDDAASAAGDIEIVDMPDASANAEPAPLRVKEVPVGDGEDFELSDDAEIDDFVSKFIEAQAESAAGQ